MKKSFKPGDILSPIPAVMVSCGDGKVQNIITIAWTGTINSDPPMTYISVRPSRFSHDIIEKTGEFVINLTTEGLAKAADWCGVKSGKDVDKFKEMKLTAIPAEKLSCPMIKESPVNLECKVVKKISLPSHDMFMAEIVAMHVDEEFVSESGKIEVEKSGLVAYIHGDYFGIKRNPIGRFGFSVMKPKTRKRINREKAQAKARSSKHGSGKSGGDKRSGGKIGGGKIGGGKTGGGKIGGGY